MVIRFSFRKAVLIGLALVFAFVMFNVLALAAHAQQDTSKGATFRPNITIPGSKFIAGQEVVINGDTIGEWIAAFYVFFVGIAGILATVMIMWGGYKYITSFGNATRTQGAKDTITQALIGLAMTLGAYIILLTINPNLVQFKSLTLAPIPSHELGERGEASLKGAAHWDGNNVATYDNLLRAAADSYGLDRDWMKAIMLVESGGNPNAVSPAQACGLMQLLPSTANLTCEQLKNPAANIDAAGKYLRSLTNLTCPQNATLRDNTAVSCDPRKTKCRNGDIHYIVAAYNGGVGANCSSVSCPGSTWWECPVNTGFDETRSYVQLVQTAYDKIKLNGW